MLPIFHQGMNRSLARRAAQRADLLQAAPSYSRIGGFSSEARNIDDKAETRSLEITASPLFGYFAGDISTEAARSPQDILKMPPSLFGISSMVNMSTGVESFSDFIGTLAISWPAIFSV